MLPSPQMKQCSLLHTQEIKIRKCCWQTCDLEKGKKIYVYHSILFYLVCFETDQKYIASIFLFLRGDTLVVFIHKPYKQAILSSAGI